MLPLNRIYNLDCIDFLQKLDDLSADLAIIDPPYNMQKADWDTFPSQEAFLEFTFRWIDALLPKLSKQGSLYLFNTPYNCAFILPYLLQKGLLFQNWITWDKRDGLGSSTRKYSNGQESILFCTKGQRHIFNYNAIRVPYESTERIQHASKKGILKNGKRWFPNAAGRLCGEVWHIPSERHQRKIGGKIQKMDHVTPKPLAMIERMVLASSNPGDLVVDCFVGSGTTAVAAKKLNRNFLCNDKNAEYVKLAQKELAKWDS